MVTTIVRTSPLPLALGVNYAAMMALAIAVNLLPVFYTTLAGEWRLSHEQLGRIGAVTFVGLVAGILLTGPLADRFGARRFAILGNALIAGGLVVLARAPNYPVLLVAVAVMGFGAGILDMVLSPIVCALQPDRRTTAMNWLHSFYCVGAVVTVFVAAQALRAGVAWRTIALWLILLPAAVTASFLALHIPPLIPEGARLRTRELFARPIFLLALFAIFFAGATELGMAQWLPTYAEQNLGFAKWVGGMSLLGFSVAMTLGRMIVGALGDRLKPVPLMLGCCAASAALFLAACFVPHPPLALAASIAVGLTGSCLWPSLLGVTADRYPQGGATMFGLLGASGNAGGIVMPWLVGIIADVASLPLGLATATLCPILMAIVLLWMTRSRAGV